jgi:hypothetical protein
MTDQELWAIKEDDGTYLVYPKVKSEEEAWETFFYILELSHSADRIERFKLQGCRAVKVRIEEVEHAK